MKTLQTSCSLLGGLLGWSLLGSWGSGWSLSGQTHLDVLSCDSLLLSDGVLGTSGLSLSLEVLLTEEVSLLLVNSLNQDILVLELVTLCSQVKLVVHFLVDLLGITISLEETTEDAESAHPDDLDWHTGISGTLSLSLADVTTLIINQNISIESINKLSKDHSRFSLTMLNLKPVLVSMSVRVRS